MALAPLCFGGLTAAERIEAATGLVDAIGWRLLPAAPGERLEPLLDDPARLREIRRRMDDAGLVVADVEILRVGAEGHADPVPLFAACHILGARNILVAGDDPDPARLCDRLGDLAARAGAEGLSLALEFMPWTAVPDPATALALAMQIDSPALRVLIDTLHLDRCGGNLPEAAIYADYLQICDAGAEFDPEDHAAMIAVARGERLPPGEGALDFADLIPPTLTPRPVSVEVPNRVMQAAMPERAYLARLSLATAAVLQALDARNTQAQTRLQKERSLGI